MLILLAESKTMASQQSDLTEAQRLEFTPPLQDMALKLMQNLEDLSPTQIAQILGISMQLAVKAHTLAYDFPHFLTGIKALEAFIGEAYRGLDVKSLPSQAINNCNRNLKIISSVYGILNSDDYIKPYRCEFNKKIAPGNKTPIEYFRQKVTIEIVKYIKEENYKDVINLLPADADKCIDWKTARAFAHMHRIVFQQITGEGKLKTPIASRLKELRGLMARAIVTNNISSFEELIGYKSSHFIYSPEHSKPLLPVFLAD